MTTRTKQYSLGGGLDVVTPALSVNPGRALAMVNYEPWFNGGYRRIDGFERFDGRPRPSDARFTAFEIDTLVGINEGDTLTGDDSGATGKVIGFTTVDGVNYIGVTKVTGAFDNGETLNVGAYTIESEPTVLGAPDNDTEDEWLLAAQDDYRADIQVVPGFGPVRGTWQRNAFNYAVRDDDEDYPVGTLHLASTAGWTTVGITMAHYVYFDGGGGGGATPLPEEGDTINGQTSGATAIVHRVVLHGGATGTNDAYGYLVLRSVVGTFQNNENLREGATKFADSASVSEEFELPGGGTYRFRNHNFFGGSDTYRTYAVNGVGPAFEIDENNIVSPILLPLDPETDQPPENAPFLVEIHRNHLFLAFRGGSLVHSVVGEPLILNGFLGAAEFGIGDEITGLNSVVGGVLVITTERQSLGLFGLDISDWELKLVGEKTGGKLYTAIKLDTVYALDDLGITSLARVQSFGDFTGATVSQLVQPIIQALRENVTDASIVRGSNQYRVYFSDNSGLIMYVPAPGQEREGTATPMRVEFGYLSYPFPVNKIYNTEDETGRERSYFTSDDETPEGYVFEDQIGTSFDGELIRSYVRLAFNHVGSPAYRKRFRRADLELNSSKPLTLKFVHDLSYGSSEISSGIADLTSVDVEQIDIFAGGGFWDVDNWDEFYWDGQNISTARANLDGTGENIGFVIFNESAISRPFILQGITLHYDLRRLQR